ncbi:MAG TPA: hypothetical protein VJ828_20600 [Lacipirellulaceae bacterium]|nr:hypothetical protein [Lacipirellulaceae bacterium]
MGPDVYILLDSEGRPQPVPGMTYEDFMAAWKQLQNVGTPNRQPRFTIESVEANGAVRGRHAELRFEATVHLLTDESVEVPLGLTGAILDGRAKFDRTGSDDLESGERGEPPSVEPYLDYDVERGGFVARLAGHANQRHTVSLHLLVPLAREGTSTTLTLAAPRAVSSRLALKVDSAIADVSVVGGALTGEDPLPDGTRITVEGITGPLRLSWRPTDPEAQRYASVLSSEGAIRVSVDGRSVRTDARLTVQSFGGSFDRFRVRLPAGAQLVQGARGPEADENPDYRVSVEESLRSDVNPPNEQGQVVLVEFPAMQQGPVTVELSTEQPIGLGDDLAAELSGFDVLGAVRQYGDVALQVAGDWQARWDLGRYVRQVDPSEIDPQLPQADLTAAFQYDRQPWSLRARIASRQFRVLVTPMYELECTSDEARLAVHFTYQVLGARAFEFRVNLAGWELTADPVESAGLVDRDQMAVTDDGILLLPLTQGSSRRAEITFFVRRAIPRAGLRIRLPLPVPIADSIGTGELVVAPASDVNLLPDLANSIGLVAMPLVEPVDSPGSETAAAQQFRVTLPEAVFAADRVTRTREVSNESAAQISFEPFDVRVEQRIDYVVRYEPIKELMFEVPQELALDEENLGIYIAPQAGRVQNGANLLELPVSLASTMGSVESSDSLATRRMRAVLPNPRLGEFSLQVRYRFPRPNVGASNRRWRLPLVRPIDGRAGAQRAVVTSPVGFTLMLDAKSDDSSWKMASPDVMRQRDPSYEFVADGSETFLPLAINKAVIDTPAATTIERAWLQSWFSGEMRQDRAAFRLRTTGPQVTVELPPEVSPEEIEVLLDGRAADVVSRNAGRVVARLPRTPSHAALRSAEPASHTLELRYRQASRNSLVSWHDLTPPQVVGTTTLSGVYWQIVLPGDRHVVRAPRQMTSASHWQWLGSFWGRRPILNQAKLEQWAGASTQLPATGLHNEYLFTSIAPLSSIALVVAPRWLVVLAASTCVLLLVLAWIYLPILRRVQIVIAAAILVAGLATAFPIPALLLAQASVLGVVLSGLALLVARLVARPTRWPVVLPAGSSLRPPMSRAESIVMPPVAATASTSPTISLRLSESE